MTAPSLKSAPDNDHKDYRSGGGTEAAVNDNRTVAEAKAKVSVAPDRAPPDGPPTIARDGETTAAIVPAEGEALRESGIEIERLKDVATPPDL
jgi:hypothetical protein